MRTFSLLLALAIALLSGTAGASGPCPGGRCHVAQKAKTTVKATTRVVTPPVRAMRRAVGR
jgi:hypothetical protein